MGKVLEREFTFESDAISDANGCHTIEVTLHVECIDGEEFEYEIYQIWDFTSSIEHKFSDLTTEQQDEITSRSDAYAQDWAHDAYQGYCDGLTEYNGDD